jgi:hypothetical protein
MGVQPMPTACRRSTLAQFTSRARTSVQLGVPELLTLININFSTALNDGYRGPSGSSGSQGDRHDVEKR